MAELIGKITYCDVYPYELKKLQFTIVASHDQSFGNAVQAILDHGFELANIKLVYNPRAAYANVVADPEENLVAVIWTESKLGKQPVLVDVEKIEDLGTIMKRVSNHGA
jgi:hypothetical protein